MKLKFLSAPILTILVVSTGILAQNEGNPSTTRQTPLVKTPTPTPTPKLSETLSKTLDNFSKDEVSRERREQAYAKLLEGQRYVWGMTRQRGQSSSSSGVRLAKQAFQKAVELNPSLAEGYTALAELALTSQPADMNEAISLATIAVKIDKNNFGAQRILSRLY